MKPTLVALAGPSGSGKSLLARLLRDELGPGACTVVPVDHFYRDFSALPPERRAEIDFDDPSVLDADEIARVLDALLAGKSAEAPVYDFTTHSRSQLGEILHPAPLILVEGIFALHLDVVRIRSVDTWYLDVDADTCLARRLERDVRERGRSEGEVRWRFERWVRPSMQRFVMPQREKARVRLDGTLKLVDLVNAGLRALGSSRVHQPPTAFENVPPVYGQLAARMGLAPLADRLARQASHWAGLNHQGEGALSVERWIPIDTLVGNLLRWTGLSGLALRGAADVRVERNIVTSAAVPPELDGFTLLHLSDLHPDLETGMVPTVLKLLQNLTYDAAVITGDYRNSTRSDFADGVRLTGDIVKALKQPVFGILGNHDFVEMVPLLEQSGMRMLLNESIVLRHGGARLLITGVDDPHFYQAHDLVRAGRMPEQSGLFRLLLSHSPELYREAEGWFDLMLSGHTHGGQLCLPGGIPIIRNGRCPSRMLAGAWSHQRLQGYTSRGTGCCGVPGRLFCPPEITLHTLKRG